MFERLSNSWELVKASARVLSADKELVVFPLISAGALVLVSAFFVVPMVLLGADGRVTDSPLGVVAALLFYVATSFVIFFCNSALVGAALIRLRGGDPTVADGFRIAFDKVGLIFGYAVVAATVGVLLRAIQERAGILGRIVTGLIGVVWNLATFLAVPVLVSEEVGPVEAVKRSASLLRETWGEQVVGNFGVGTVTGLAGFALTVTFVPLVVLAAASTSPWLLGLTIGAYVFSLMALALASATLSGIYTAAVYRYAAEGEVGEGFEPAMVEGAFRPK
jgi:hypothetical protein